MNRRTKLNEILIKETLCNHFNTSFATSDLAIRERRFFGLGGGEFRYYYFTLTNNGTTHRAFGKVAGRLEQEYEALQHLVKTVPEQHRRIGHPIALLRDRDQALLLLEYLEGYSNSFTIRGSLRLLPNIYLSITRMGECILDSIYDLQRHGQTTYSPLSLDDTKSTPGQPSPIGVLKQIDTINALSRETKATLRTRINALLQNQTMVRRGLVHGTLGVRNVMVRRSCIAFIDWAYMQYEGLCIFDPCYLVTMLLMKAVQLFISQSQLDRMSNLLFEHIEQLENHAWQGNNNMRIEDPTFIQDGLWFGKSLAMIDTLWQYERPEMSWVKESLTQRRRQLKYLAYRIEKDAVNGGACDAPLRPSSDIQVTRPKSR
jgi:hypothetical protein